MAIDSEAKRKSVVAVGAYFVGPVVVPDGSLSVSDRRVIGYGYFATVPAGFIKIRNVRLRAAYATATLKTARATATLRA